MEEFEIDRLIREYREARDVVTIKQDEHQEALYARDRAFQSLCDAQEVAEAAEEALWDHINRRDLA